MRDAVLDNVEGVNRDVVDTDAWQAGVTKSARLARAILRRFDSYENFLYEGVIPEMCSAVGLIKFRLRRRLADGFGITRREARALELRILRRREEAPLTNVPPSTDLEKALNEVSPVRWALKSEEKLRRIRAERDAAKGEARRWKEIAESWEKKYYKATLPRALRAMEEADAQLKRNLYADRRLKFGR